MLGKVLSWYQEKIAKYDKQQWEASIEKRILKGLRNVPKKSGRIKTELIDVDLVRGSTFPKTKPKHGWSVITRRGLLRVFFLPLFYKWWQEETSFAIFLFLLSCYVAQVISLGLYLFLPYTYSSQQQLVTSTEVFCPLLLMIVLGALHSQIVSSHHSSKPSQSARKHGESLRGASKTDNSSNDSFENLEQRRVKRRRSSKKSSSSTSLRRKIVKPKCNQNIIGENVLSKEDKIKRTRISCNTESNNESDSPEFEQLSCHQEDTGLACLSFDALAPPTELPEPEGEILSLDNPETPVLCSLTDDSHFRKRCIHSTNLPYDLDMEKKQSIDQLKPPQTTLRQSSCESPDSYSDSDCNTNAKDSLGEMDWSLGSNTDGVTSDSSVSTQVTGSDDYVASDTGGWASPNGPDIGMTPACYTHSDRGQPHVSCRIWEYKECKKVDLSLFDIASTIIQKVELVQDCDDYLYIGLILSVTLAILPFGFHIVEKAHLDTGNITTLNTIGTELKQSAVNIMSSDIRQLSLLLIGCIERLCLAGIFFFFLSVAERTFKQRFCYAKFFCHLTSARRAEKSELPHFRLNKVRNIKTWLSLRSYLKRRGPQRSVDVIVSTAFLIDLCLLSVLCVQMITDHSSFLNSLFNWEILAWSLGIAAFLLRFMTLGTKINRKYCNLSVLITEQINLYLQMEQKPHKKNELMLANHVTKLAAALLKELESPFKISGMSANPLLYNITKVVVLSAFSAALTELLGFKLKLYKIKL